MMTLTVGAAVVDAESNDAAIAELMDARTEGGGEMTVVLRILTQGRFPTIL